MNERDILCSKTINLITKFFITNGINWYHTSTGTAYKELFHRQTCHCFSFYDRDNIQYYMYLNTAFDSELSRMVFTSISIVSRENLNKKIPTLEVKQHVDLVDDVKQFLKSLKEVI